MHSTAHDRPARLTRLILAASLCGVFSAALAAQPPAPSASMGPRLVLSTTEFDLGRIDPRGDTRRSVDIEVRNTGDQPLEIRNIRTTCPCLRAELGATTLAPGASTRLRLTYEVDQLNEDIEHEALIYSNDSSEPVAKIRAAGSLGTSIRIFPESIAIGAVLRHELDREYRVRLTPLDGAPLGQVRVSSRHPLIRPEARRLDDGSHEVVVRIDQKIRIGPFEERIKVETEHPGTPVLEFEVFGMVLGNFEPLGRRIDFGFIKEGQPASVTFRLENRDGRDVKIVRTTPLLPVPGEVEATRDGKDINLVVRVAGAPAFTRLRGAVEVHTDDAEEPMIRIPVFGGVLADKPFERAAADGADSKLLAIVVDALERGTRIPDDRFFTDVLGGVKDERAAALLLRALDDENVPVRMRAVELLSGFDSPAVRDRLRTLITDDPEEFVRRRAVVRYAEIVGKPAVPLLLLALRDDAPWVREETANYLGKLGDAAAIPALRAAVNDPDPDAAAAIRTALAALQAIHR